MFSALTSVPCISSKTIVMQSFLVSDSWEDFVFFRQTNPGPISKASFSSWKKNGGKNRPGFSKYWRRRQRKLDQKKKNEQKRRDKETKKKEERTSIERPK